MPFQVYTISNSPLSTYSYFRIPSWKDPTIPFCNTFDLISQPSPYLTPKKLNTSRALRCQSRKIHHAKTVPVTTCSSLSLLADYETPFLHSCVWWTRVIYMCVRCLLLILHSSTRTGPDTLHSSWKINTAFHTLVYRIPAIASHRTDPSRDTWATLWSSCLTDEAWQTSTFDDSRLWMPLRPSDHELEYCCLQICIEYLLFQHDNLRLPRKNCIPSMQLDICYISVAELVM